MLRKIVVLKGGLALSPSAGGGWKTMAVAPATAVLDKSMRASGVKFRDDRVLIPLFRAASSSGPMPGMGYGGADAPSIAHEGRFAAVAEFEDEDAVERLKADYAASVVEVYADPMIQATAPYCGNGAQGTFKDVRNALPVSALKNAGLTGKGIRAVVVDTGIHGSHLGPDGKALSTSLAPLGWSPRPGYVPGSAPVDHGTMVSYDILLGAPEATLIDYALLQSNGNTWNAFLSDALAGFASLIALLQREPGPLVVNNSWGMFDRSDDEPIGKPGNYSANPRHPFNEMTAALVAAGADVLFAAGNCGQQCPDGRCGPRDIGPGASIHGANSHPSVITVAAVTVNDDRLGYSSQGPGGLSPKKPDLAGFSHFAGSKVYNADGGTSAASPVVAGVVAALRQLDATMPPAVLKGVLQSTARSTGAVWNRDIGYGIIDAAAAVAQLSKPPVVPPAGASPFAKPDRAAAWMHDKTRA